MVLALYVQSEATAERYNSPAVLWTLVPLILFWQFRIWLATTRGEMRDDPITFAARDWVTWLVAAACFIILLVAKSFNILANRTALGSGGFSLRGSIPYSQY